MRKIKFRGQEIDTKKFVYGDLAQMEPYISNGIYCTIKTEPYVSKKVNTETVGQFTGLTDKNGVEIYEGDILGGCNGSINGHEWKQEPIIITFEYGRFNVPLWAAKGEWDSTHYLIVIGNIHDNPELLQ